MLQSIIKLAEDNLVRDKFLYPAVLLLSDVGMVIIDVGEDGFSSDEEKNKTVYAIAMTIQKYNIYSVFIITEAWAYEGKDVDKALLDKWIEDGSYREKLKRRECYTVNEIKKSSTISATRFFNRGEDESIIFEGDVEITTDTKLVRFKIIQDSLKEIS